MNLPNLLTTFRLAVVPFFMWAVYQPGGMHLALALFLIASITDFFDGFLARRWNMISDYGKVMDPLADKMLVTAALVAFVEFRWVESWTVVIILGRDVLIGGLRQLLAEQGEVMGAGWLGKIKTTLQLIAIGMLLAGLMRVGYLTYLAAVVMTVWSGIDYVWRSRALLRSAKFLGTLGEPVAETPAESASEPTQR